MKLNELKTNKQYTFESVQCKLISNFKFLTLNGTIKINSAENYSLINKDGEYIFTIKDTQVAKLIDSYITQHYYNLCEIVSLDNDSNTFFLHIVFFVQKKRLGTLEIIVDDKIKTQLENHKLISNNDKSEEQSLHELSNKFKLFNTETNNDYLFAYSKKIIFEKNSDILNTDIDNEFLESEEDENSSASLSNGMSSMVLYGKYFDMYISIIGQGFDEKLVAKRVTFHKNNIPCMFLGVGKIEFSTHSSYVSKRVKEIISTDNGYIQLWDKYAEKEGEFLLKKARKIGIINYNKNISTEDNGILLTINNDSLDKLKFLKSGDFLNFSQEIPYYLQDTEITWNDYKEYLNKKWLLEKEIGQKDDSYSVKISKINNNSILLPLDSNVSGILSYSIRGDQTQIKRREKARNSIKLGNCANQRLALIIQGDYSSDVISLQENNNIKKIAPLSASVKNKIFKHEPTDTQCSAIDIALNTPDIAIIQGPPGTGKTTVITAIIERLNEISNKNNSIEGKVLITSLQHDAVLNVTERLRINSLPTIKFGNKNDDNNIIYEKYIDDWCNDVSKKLCDKYTFIQENEKITKLTQLIDRYSYIPSNDRALEFLNFAKQITYNQDLISDIDIILEELSQNNTFQNNDILKSIFRLRTTREGFLDDGSENVIELLSNLEPLLNNSNAENLKILNVLKKASIVSNENISEELLKSLSNIKDILLTKCIPKPYYKKENPREDIVDIYNRVKKDIKKPTDEFQSAIFNLLNELDNNAISIKETLKKYSFVYSATLQQSESKEIRKAKNILDNSSPTYDIVIVDESARANPGDLMIPLAQAKEKIILVGDHRQLPHMYDEEIFEELSKDDNISNSENIKISMFEHLMKSAKKLEQVDGIKRTITLDAQYRMHPLLGNFVNENFYKKYNESFKSPLPEKFFEQPIYPVPLVWIDIKNQYGSERKEGTSRVRDCEVKYIVNQIKKYLDNPEYENLSFGVISFYSGQVKAIKKALGSLSNRVRVGSVDAFQGMEFDVIFLSVVRSYDHFKDLESIEKLTTDISNLSETDEDYIEYQKYLDKLKMSNYGFLTSENRLCVALSRQKKLLIVVGNSDIFTGELAGKVAERCVPAMKNLFDLCMEKGIYEQYSNT